MSALPAGLATPQALSPTTPPSGEATFQSGQADGQADAASAGGGDDMARMAGGVMLFPSTVVLSPGTDSDRGSSNSSIVAGGERAGGGVETFGMDEKEADFGREAAATGALSPWITTREGICY